MTGLFYRGAVRLADAMAVRFAVVAIAASLKYAFFSFSPAAAQAATAVADSASRAEAIVALADFDHQVDALLARMTLAEKIGQMTQAELASLGDLSAVSELALGSVLCGGGSDPEAGNSVVAWADANDACQQAAQRTRLKIPLLFGIDAVHGHSNVLGAVIFPHNVGLGCARDAELVEEIGRATALEVRATGINWTFAPCVAAPRDDRWGRTYEGYSEDPQLCGVLGAALVRGLQGADLKDPRRVLACAKHFVGDGGTSAQTAPPSEDGRLRVILDQGDTRIDEQTLRAIHLTPYRFAIDAGVGSVMVSYSSLNGVKCSANKRLLTDVLKQELGFDGLVISDYNAIAQVDEDFRTAIAKSINAGLDMAMEPNRYRDFIELLTDLVNEGEVPIERIDDAVRRILRVKAAMGLLGPEPHVTADRSLIESDFGSPAHRELARRAVRQSLVVLKNDGPILPLADEATGRIVVVAGSGADDLGMHCGGWTIAWQGERGEVTSGGTTILAALRAELGAERVIHSPDGQFFGPAADVEAAVVVVGEPPYAEGNGDDAELAMSDADLQTIRRVRASGVPLVLVILSGRPLVLGEALDSADAIVAAWLPGTEGAGVVDVLMGDYAPTGKLSFSWPRSVAQHPLNVGDDDYDPLFRFGHGLTYGE